VNARIVFRVTADGDSPEAERAVLAGLVRAAHDGMMRLSPFATVSCERTELASEPWVLERKGKRVALTRREREIAAGIVAGLRRGEIAEQFDINPTTFDSHRLNLMRTMGCANEVQLTRLAIARGWVEL
jgi:DNA-binding NarL/FixJ family response regulator